MLPSRSLSNLESHGWFSISLLCCEAIERGVFKMGMFLVFELEKANRASCNCSLSGRDARNQTNAEFVISALNPLSV